MDRINPDRSGRQLARAVKNALDEAGAAPEDIDYISLDGMADDVWDYGEADAIKMVFGERAGDVPVSCPKSMFGNLLGASGALDVIIALLAMEHSLIPPTLNLRDPDPVWLNYVKDKALERRVDKALVISRGRGGINSALVVEKA